MQKNEKNKNFRVLKCKNPDSTSKNSLGYIVINISLHTAQKIKFKKIK